MPLLADVAHQCHQVLREGVCIAGEGLVERLSAASSPSQRRSPVGLPSFTPRALAAASASLVRVEIARARAERQDNVVHADLAESSTSGTHSSD